MAWAHGRAPIRLPSLGRLPLVLHVYDVKLSAVLVAHGPAKQTYHYLFRLPAIELVGRDVVEDVGVIAGHYPARVIFEINHIEIACVRAYHHRSPFSHQVSSLGGQVGL